MNNYEASYSAEREERDHCLEDLRFALVPGSQWTDTATQTRRDRPRFEINKIASAINTIIGDQRQNRVSIKVRPEDEGSLETSEVLAGLIRSICHSSNFNDVKDQAFKEQITGGFAGWYVTTQYKEGSFDQEIVIKSIPSAAASYFYDPSSTDFLKRDANWQMICTDISTEEFEKKYPEAAKSPLPSYLTSLSQQWQDRKTVRIATYYVKVPTTRELVLLSNGDVYENNEDFKKIEDELLTQGIEVVKKRTEAYHKIMIYKLSAAGILEKPYEWAGKYIPAVPLFGYSVWINGQHYYKGIVRDSKDSQRVYNYATSQAVEVSALSPKDPYWMTPKQAKGHETQLKNFNNKNDPFMFYNEDPENPGPPKRTGAPSVQSALLQQIQQANVDIQATTGLFAPSLGQEQRSDQSGRAILALQRQGNQSSYELYDNLQKSIAYTGEIILDLIPKIYDTERQVNVLSEDGTSKSVPINSIMLDYETNELVSINKLDQGKYKVISTTGPSYATKRSEGLNFLLKLAESNELFSQIASDLIAKNVDFEYSEELAERVRKQLLLQGFVDPTEEELAKIPQDQGLSPLELMNLELQKLNLEQQAAIVDGLELQNEKIKMDILHKGSQTEENLASAAEKDSKIAKTLAEDGVMMVNPERLATRQKNLQLLNDAIELNQEDADRVSQFNLEPTPIPPELFNPDQ